MSNIIAIFVFVLCLLAGPVVAAQNVRLENKTFTSVPNEKGKKEDVKTGYTWKDKSGTYDIYLSSKGNAYINKVSKNGKTYRKYLPKEVGEQIKKGL